VRWTKVNPPTVTFLKITTGLGNYHMGDMTMKKNQKRLIALAIMMAASPIYAASLSEVEANHPLDSSQYLSVSASNPHQLSAAIGTVGATETIVMPGGSIVIPATTDDLDYFSFYANAGDVVTFDIDGGVDGQEYVDTILAVFDNNKILLRMSDESDSIDSGSVSTADARIDSFVVPASGVYYVGVSNYPRFFHDGGDVDVAPVSGGDYTLNITSVAPAPVATTSTSTSSVPSVPTVQEISIEVKPGVRALSSPNPKAQAKIPVALLSGRNFNAMDIDTSTVKFGATGSETSPSKCSTAGQDVNGDGLPDMLCHFENQAAGFKMSSIEGKVTGTTRTGIAFEGRGLLKVVPAKTKPTSRKSR
jgi:hypothetical protein